MIATNRFLFATGNNHGVLPVQDRLLDSNSLLKDYLVSEQSDFNIRSIFIYLLTYTERATGLERELVYLFFFCVTSLLFVHAISLLTSLFVEDKIKALILLLFITQSSMGSIGSSELLSEGLLPSSFAIPLGIYGFYFYLKERYNFVAFLLALATIFHVLIGLLFAVVIFGSIGLKNIFGLIKSKNFKDPSIKNFLLSSTIFLILASPSWFPLIFLDNSSHGVNDSQLIGFIIGEFRNPHHYIPSTWPWEQVVIFFLAELVVVMIILSKKVSFLKKYKNELLINILVLNLLFGIGYIFVELIPITSIIKLQLFRISILSLLIIKLVLGLAFIQSISKGYFSLIFFPLSIFILTTRYESFSNDLLLLIFISISLASLILLLREKKILLLPKISLLYLLIFTAVSCLQANYRYQIKFQNYEPNRAGLYQWIKENSQEQSLFITPISFYDFRYGAERAMIISYKSFMFKEDQMIEWYSRVGDLCNESEPSCNGWRCTDYCDERYKSINYAQFLKLDEKYDADYLVTFIDADELPFMEVYADDRYKVYKLE